MKTIHALTALCCGLLAEIAAPEPANLVVHEWGTFTTMAGSDGVPLTGLHLEEESLPPFVFRQQFGYAKGISNVSGVTVKMETPVLYFYADQKIAAKVRVGFDGGSISEWYPQRSAGEPITFALDLAKPYQGSIDWSFDILAPDTDVRPTPDPRQVTPVWEAPRRTGANLVQGEFGEIEHYLFYRGVGNFETPVITFYDANETLHVQNTGPKTIPFAFVYDKEEGDQVRISWLAALAPGENQTVQTVNLRGTMQAVETQLRATFVRALTAEGLYGDEAEAMLDTWWHSYFQKPGLRVFWVVPRAFTDAILPIELEPTPTELIRVMVGRSEVLSPTFERELVHSFSAEENPHATHRFAPAYRARVNALRNLP